MAGEGEMFSFLAFIEEELLYWFTLSPVIYCANSWSKFESLAFLPGWGSTGGSSLAGCLI